MILRCRPTTFIASVAGGMRCDQAYQWSTNGSPTTLAFRKSFSALIFMLLTKAGKAGRPDSKTIQYDPSFVRVAYEKRSILFALEDRLGAVLEQVNQTAAHLSPTAQRFLNYVTGAPERARRLDHLSPGDYFAALQSWPTFIGAEKLAEIHRATISLTQLVKSIPERIFGNDPRRIAAYYGFPTE